MTKFFILTATLSAVLLLVSVLSYGRFAEHFENSKDTMKKNLKKIHDLATGVEHADDADGENFENEFYEYAEEYKRKGADEMQAANMANSKMRSKYGKRYEQHSKAAGNKVHNIKGNPYAGTTALFDVVLHRDSINIAQPLPVPIFAAIHYAASYRGIINNYLPAGVTISAIAIDANGSVVISYFDGVNTDTITISCVQVPYITFLSASEFNAMQINKFRYRISDTAHLEQYDQLFETAQKSLFGRFSSNQVSIAAQIKPSDFKNNVVDVDYTIPINYEKGIVCGLIPIARFQVTLSCFVQRYERTNIHS